MKNAGMFSALFINSLRKKVSMDDAASGRMTVLAHSLQMYEISDSDDVWNAFLKQAVSYLEFVPPPRRRERRLFPLYEDWKCNNCVSVLIAAPGNSDLDSYDVGQFYPGKLIRELRKRSLSWGILTNGKLWRLYSARSSRPFEDYVELDLSSTLKENDETEYALFEHFFHRDSFVSDEEKNTELPSCRLHADRRASEGMLDELVKKPFLAQVDEVLRCICNGFISDTRKPGEEYTEENCREIFESAVTLIYRTLFLFYAESRRLLPSDPEKADLYWRHSIRALCEESLKFRWGERRDNNEYDLWQHLKELTVAVNNGDPEYGIMGYNGGLFDDEEERFLRDHRLRNDFLSRALYLLAYVDPRDNNKNREYAIPYEDLEIRHLGGLYENILEYTVLVADADRIRRQTGKGIEIMLAEGQTKRRGDSIIKKGEVYFGESSLERKQTGSYYTPESLIRFLNEKSIVVPLMERFEAAYRERFNAFKQEALESIDPGTRRGAAQAGAELVSRFAEEELLSYTVCDPAMGSGHFLVDATNQMAGIVITLLAELPHVAGMSSAISNNPNFWRRRVTRRCIYGVDLNLLAVNLAKLSLWLNCFASDHKLTFLDHHVRCGNSLIGIRNVKNLRQIPKRGNDRKNKKNDEGDSLFNVDDLSAALTEAAGGIAGIARINEDDTDRQRESLREAEKTLARVRPLADIYTAYVMNPTILLDEYRQLFTKLASGEDASSSLNLELSEIYRQARELSARHNYFHWPLVFPNVFGSEGSGGFNATVGNPPWDVLQANTQEFYVNYDPQFRKYKKQDALQSIRDLHLQYPSLSEHWIAYQKGFQESATFCKEPAVYRSLINGKINLYKAFLERFFQLLSAGGRMGLIVPSGIYTDKGCQPLRELFFERSSVEFLYGFENRYPMVFNSVDSRLKFVLFGARRGGTTERFRCAFMEHDPERLPFIDRNALHTNIEQVRRFSPNTLSIMEFKNQRDIDVTTKIYGNWPLLGEKIEGTWNARFRQELNMTSDSHLFKTTPTEHPLYEGKMIWHFDSEFAPPQYWLDRKEVTASLGETAYEGEHYRVGFRNIAMGTNERTLIATLIPPRCWSGNSLSMISPRESHQLSDRPNEFVSMYLAAVLSSLVVDFIIRQKVTSNMSFFYMKTLPVPRKFTTVSGDIARAIVARSARLIATSAKYANIWRALFREEWSRPEFWYSAELPQNTYGPAHEQEIRERIQRNAIKLTNTWEPHCGVHERRHDRRDTGDRAQLRAEIDAYAAHLYELSREDFTHILDTFSVLKNKEIKAFGEYITRRKCLEEYERMSERIRPNRDGV